MSATSKTSRPPRCPPPSIRVERLDDRAQRENEVGAGVPVRDGIDVQVVDAPSMRLEVLERASRQVTDDLELHQRDRTPSMWTSSDAIGSPTIRRARTGRATAPSRHLGQLEPVLDDDAKLHGEPSPQVDVDSLLDPPWQQTREAAAPGEGDDSVALAAAAPTIWAIASGAMAMRPRSVVAITNGSRSTGASLSG